jgi:hypothetical protein
MQHLQTKDVEEVCDKYHELQYYPGAVTLLLSHYKSLQQSQQVVPEISNIVNTRFL